MERKKKVLYLPVLLSMVFLFISCGGNGGNSDEPPPIIMSLTSEEVTPCSVRVTWTPVQASEYPQYQFQYQLHPENNPYVSCDDIPYSDYLECYYSFAWDDYSYSVDVGNMCPGVGDEHCFWVELWGMAPGWPGPAIAFLGVSNTLCIDLPPDITPPLAPIRLEVVSDGGSEVLLDWSTSHSTDNCSIENKRTYQEGAIYYRIYRDDVLYQDLVYPPYIDTNINPDSSYKYQLAAVDSSGNESDKTVSTYAFTAWSSVVDVVYNQRPNSSMVLDSSGKSHISYYKSKESGLGNKGSIMYATNVLGNWDTFELNTTAAMQSVWTSIALDSSDNVHIVYNTGENTEGIKHATNMSGFWLTETVDSGWVGQRSTIDVDNSGYAHISYNGYQDGTLKYATNISGIWITTTLTIVKTAWDSYGGGSSITLDSDDNPHISYCDDINDDLMYAVATSGSWVFTTLESEGDTGRNPSLWIDENDNLHFAYCNMSNNTQNYATNATGQWSIDVIDTYGDDCASSITGDINGDIHIAYSNYEHSADWFTNTSGQMYANNTSGTWNTYRVYAGTNSIQAGSLGRIHRLSERQAWPYTEILYTVHSAY